MVIAPRVPVLEPDSLTEIGYTYDPSLDKWTLADQAADFLYLGHTDLTFGLPGTLKKIFDFDCWISLGEPADAFPLFTVDQYRTAAHHSPRINFVLAGLDDLTGDALRPIAGDPRTVLVLHTHNAHAMPELRRALIELMQNGLRTPVILKRDYPPLSTDDLMLYSATDLGALLVDGLGDGIWLGATDASLETINRTGFGILQATRTRISKTEYISCPSCGRTLFDLQETTARIRQRTEHLKGVKIGIMGCIVNGPGEMADADYGYVGSGPGKISLYKGKEIVKRNVPTAGAVDELIDLIREDGRWIDP